MDITLINPPGTNMNYVPLGILTLKGYLANKQNITGELNINITDLNTKYFDYKFLVQKNKSYCIWCRKHKRCQNKNYFPKEVLSFNYKIKYCESIVLRDFLLNNSELKIQWETKEILSNNPVAIGFSVFNSFVFGDPFSSRQLLFSLALAKVIKNIDTSIKIIFGGASFYSIDQNQELMSIFPYIDIIVKGEGEIPLLAIIKRLKNNNCNNFEGIPNITWRKKSISQNKAINFKRFEYSIPDYSGISLNYYSNLFPNQVILPLKLSSGCYWARCKFCTFYKFSNFKIKTSKNIINEISYYIKDLNINAFQIVDEAVHPDVSSCFAEIIKKNHWNISYMVLARPTRYFTKKLLLKLYKSGCKIILWGIETFSQDLLNKIEKGLYVEDIATVLKNSHNVGICNIVFYIYCFPTQTLRDIKYDYEFLRKYIEYITVLFYNPFRLERESIFYEQFYHRDKKILIPIFKKGKDTVNSLLCRYAHNKKIIKYFYSTILPYVKKNTVYLSERKLLKLLNQYNNLNSKNIKWFLSYNRTLDNACTLFLSLAICRITLYF